MSNKPWIPRHLWLQRGRGFTIMEMIVAIVVIGVAVAGLMAAFGTGTRGSADPTVRIQLQAVAEELMEEILLKPYAQGTAATATACARSDFDEPMDYNGYTTTNKVCDVAGLPIDGLAGYSVKVTAATGTLVGVADATKVTVTVNRGTESFALVSWRTNY